MISSYVYAARLATGRITTHSWNLDGRWVEFVSIFSFISSYSGTQRNIFNNVITSLASILSFVAIVKVFIKFLEAVSTYLCVIDVPTLSLIGLNLRHLNDLNDGKQIKSMGYILSKLRLRKRTRKRGRRGRYGYGRHGHGRHGRLRQGRLGRALNVLPRNCGKKAGSTPCSCIYISSVALLRAPLV